MKLNNIFYFVDIFFSVCPNKKSIHHPSKNTYDFVRGLSLKFTTSGDMTLVESNSDSRLGNHCMYDEREGAMGFFASYSLCWCQRTAALPLRKIVVRIGKNPDWKKYKNSKGVRVGPQL